MIRLSDAMTLAFTKLRVRRMRTVVTIILASLLFGGISMATFVLQGSADSIDRFTAGTLADRYLTTVTNTSQVSFVDNFPKSVEDRAVEIHNQIVRDKTAAAKKLGISYDPLTEQRPITRSGDLEMLNSASPSAIQALNEYTRTQKSSMQQVDEIVGKYNIKKKYTVERGGAFDGQLKLIENGKEDFTKNPEYPMGGTADINFGWSYIDEAVVKPFMIPQSRIEAQKNTTAIPVIAPFSKVEKSLGLKPLSQDASAVDKLERTRYVRDHAGDATFNACYRNDISESQIRSALDVQQEIEKNKNNKDYQKPSLIYGLPEDDKCAPATIIADTRTGLEKQQDQKQQDFQRMFGQETRPMQQKVTFRVVGLAPDAYTTSDSLSGIDNLINTIAGSSLEGQWVVPQQMFDELPNRGDYTRFTSSMPQPITTPRFDSARAIVEFDSSQEAKLFVDREGCGRSYCDGATAVTYFGSNSVLVDDLKLQAIKILSYLGVGVGSVAIIIMMGMVGRVVTDSRRETAVFRAIGAKRNDIRLIYFFYTLTLSGIIAVSSITFGFAAASVFNAWLSPIATAQAHLIYIFADDNLRIEFTSIWWSALASIVGLIIATGLIGVTLPILRNSARSPIKDMRDDS